jgi:hypothetical protein
MKKILFTTAFLIFASVRSGHGVEPQFLISEKGPHHAVWSKTVEEELADGSVVNRNHSYTEMSCGLNYWSDDQKDWLPSTEDVEIINGAAVARHGAMQVIWTANPNVAGAVDLQTAEGLRFQSHILGIAFTDARTGASAFIANLKDCVGEVSGNSVIYRNAFDSISADIIYIYKRGSFEQNVLLKEALPDPTQPPWNMDPSTVRVEISTEFIGPPQAEVTTVVTKRSCALYPVERIRFRQNSCVMRAYQISISPSEMIH